PAKAIRKRLRRLLTGGPSPYAEIARLQRLYPPRYDPSNTLLMALRKNLPPEVDALFDYGIAWSGEIGEEQVSVRVRTLPASEEYVIEFFTGTKALLYTVARGLAAATRIHRKPPQPRIEPRMSGTDVAYMIGDVFTTYAFTKEIRSPHHPIHEEQIKL